MSEDKLANVTLEGVDIVFRNFSGKEGQYNRAGDRNFGVLLPKNIADDMAKDGWNVKLLRPRDEGDEPQAYIQVTVAYGSGRPPRVILVTSRGRTSLAEEDVHMLDWVDITNVDLMLRPYHWEVNGKTGVKAYLHAIYVTIEEDELEQKYADVPDSASRSVIGGSFLISEED